LRRDGPDRWKRAERGGEGKGGEQVGFPCAKLLISRSNGVDMGDSHFRQDGRVTVVGKQEHRSPPGLLRTRSIDDLVLAGSTLESRSKPVDELVVFLDLDKCSIYGQDGNDMTIACQWMQGGMDVVRRKCRAACCRHSCCDSIPCDFFCACMTLFQAPLCSWATIFLGARR